MTAAASPVMPPFPSLPRPRLRRLPRRTTQGLHTLLAALVCALSLSLAVPALAKSKHYAATGGVAIGGYDPVAYFSQSVAQPGDAGHAVRWRGVTWYFATPENRQAFEMNPAGFAPQFGGWCPVALAAGRLAAGDPDLFRILDGKLYLLETPEAAQVFEATAPETIGKAAAGWKAIPRK
ncbi:YHS domain-containing (seleno)protein [Frigidibacter sp. MR17.14]|uniref:YHS domain-containing (seleno)protein n=1 Tax=Frigidibacter sp. MR17.14 TaxID=3126509 RepID=UPI003012C38F